MKDFTYTETTLHKVVRKKNFTTVTATINLLGRSVTYTVDVDGIYDLRFVDEKQMLCIRAKNVIRDKALSIKY